MFIIIFYYICCINTSLEAELTGFLNYEKHSIEGYNTGNSRNRSYLKTIYSEYGKLSIKVPRDRGLQNLGLTRGGMSFKLIIPSFKIDIKKIIFLLKFNS